MRRGIGFVTFLLGAVGLTACLAAAIFIWVVRPTVLRSGANAFDAADNGLAVVEDKATRADAVVKRIRRTVDPIADQILTLANESQRTGGEERELARLEVELSERLAQVDAIAEAAEIAIRFLNPTSRLARSVWALASPMSAEPDTAGNKGESLAAMAEKLERLREVLAKVRNDKGLQKLLATDVVRVARDATDELNSVDAKLGEFQQKATELRTEIAEVRTAFPLWTNRAAVIGTVILVWLALGQLALASWGWKSLRSSPLSTSAPG